MSPLTKEEAFYIDATVWHWLEYIDGNTGVRDVCPVIVSSLCIPHEYLYADFDKIDKVRVSMLSLNRNKIETPIERDLMFYNITWRLWPSQPSVEESRAAPWII